MPVINCSANNTFVVETGKPVLCKTTTALIIEHLVKSESPCYWQPVLVSTLLMPVQCNMHVTARQIKFAKPYVYKQSDYSWQSVVQGNEPRDSNEKQ
jgi:hypothetical protein